MSLLAVCVKGRHDRRRGLQENEPRHERHQGLVHVNDVEPRAREQLPGAAPRARIDPKSGFGS